jgi:hypothetical protein
MGREITPLSEPGGQQTHSAGQTLSEARTTKGPVTTSEICAALRLDRNGELCRLMGSTCTTL